MEFIPYTQALELKELEFNEPCWAWYNIPDEDVRYCYSEGRGPITNIQEEWDAKIDNRPIENIGLPTFSQAFKFFREKFELRNSITDFIDDKTGIEWDYEIAIIGTDLDEKGNYKPLVDYSTDDETRKFKTYEQAELACLERLIEIIKEMENKQTSVNLHQDSDTYDAYMTNEGNINYHLERGGIEHTYFFLGENKEFACCLCGRTFFKKSKKTNNNGK